MPVPLPPAVIEIQAALLAAVQAHPAPAVTATLPVPPAAANDALAGAIVGVQLGAPGRLTGQTSMEPPSTAPRTLLRLVADA